MQLIFLGPPGAGKGTHAEDLSEALKIPHISTGDILRDAVSRGTPVGLKAKTFMESGDMVPDSVVVSIVAERLHEKDCAKGFILDGFPRNLAQAKELDDTLKTMGRKIDMAVYFKTSTKVILRRLTGRRICSKCNHVYNVDTLPPKKQDVCDLCGGALLHREDDQEKTVLHRLDVYTRETKGLVEYYRNKGVLKTADGDLVKSEGWLEILGFLNMDPKKYGKVGS